MNINQDQNMSIADRNVKSAAYSHMCRDSMVKSEMETKKIGVD
jgi:hypothetical protein